MFFLNQQFLFKALSTFIQSFKTDPPTPQKYSPHVCRKDIKNNYINAKIGKKLDRGARRPGDMAPKNNPEQKSVEEL